jgi:GntR family transcriptional regulator
MIRIDTSGVKPIYEQIYDEFVKLILLDVLKEGDNLPSVRELALTLQINPNTIQKSYKLLEGKKFIKSIKGKGNFVDSKNEAYDYYKNDLEKKLTVIVEEMMQIGIEKEEILILVEEMVNNA